MTPPKTAQKPKSGKRQTIRPTSKTRSKSPWHSIPFRTEEPRQKSWLDLVK